MHENKTREINKIKNMSEFSKEKQPFSSRLNSVEKNLSNKNKL